MFHIESWHSLRCSSVHTIGICFDLCFCDLSSNPGRLAALEPRREVTRRFGICSPVGGVFASWQAASLATSPLLVVW